MSSVKEQNIIENNKGIPIYENIAVSDKQQPKIILEDIKEATTDEILDLIDVNDYIDKEPFKSIVRTMLKTVIHAIVELPETQQKIVLLLLNDENISAKTLAKKINIHRETVYRSLQKLNKNKYFSTLRIKQ